MHTSFGELEKEIFSNFAIIHDMKAADDQQPRPMHEEDRERNFAFDNRWPNGTYAFLAIKRKWGEVKSVVSLHLWWNCTSRSLREELTLIQEH